MTQGATNVSIHIQICHNFFWNKVMLQRQNLYFRAVIKVEQFIIHSKDKAKSGFIIKSRANQLKNRANQKGNQGNQAKPFN